MNIQISRVPLQRIMRALPKPLQRIRVARLLATLAGSPYHRVAFQSGEVVGDVRDHNLTCYLVSRVFADYGYFALAEDLLLAGDTHVDLGANFGFHTFGLLRMPIGDSLKCVLVEANPTCAACLHESAKLSPGASLRIFHVAAADKAGEFKFTFDGANTGSGHLGGASVSGEAEITVPAVALDDLFEANGIARVGLMKIDIEGAETRAMRGFSRTLSSHRVDFLYFEVNPGCLEQQGSDPEALFAEFTRQGYRLFWPHADADFILRTYGPGNAPAEGLRRFLVHGNRPRTVAAFDPSCYRKGQFGQCDLLAVSPQCRVEAI